MADGTKAEVKTPDGKQGYEYLGSLIYSRNPSGGLQLESAGFAGGRIQVSGNVGSYSYEPNYHITDHLGSVRVVFKDASTIRARNDYYAFGKPHVNSLMPMADDKRNRWLYNGKENQLTGDLRFLDYGARMYDSEIARWTIPDPLAHIRTWESPFAFSANNPINRIDPDGRFPWAVLLVKGAIGAWTDIAAQIAVQMTVKERNFGEAILNLDWTSVGSSAVIGAIGAPGASTGAKATIGAAIAVDAATDVSFAEAKAIFAGKTMGEAAADAIFGAAGSAVSDAAVSGLKSAAAADMASSTFSTLSSGEKQTVRAVNAAVNSRATKIGVDLGTSFATKSMSEAIKPALQGSPSSGSSGSSANSDSLPRVDALRMNTPKLLLPPPIDDMDKHTRL
ncbi:MAG: RHS repeat-associated core domain-containing protein [Alistipes sp.]|nr:RHS repeat-associated core domain-containing protein [Alistipes sp.]